MKKRNLWIPALLSSLVYLSFSGAQGSSSHDDIPGVGELGGPSTDLPPAEMEMWLRGRELFNHHFHRSDGLGADEFNADSCRGCHQDPVLGGSGGLELNVSRFGANSSGTGPFMDLPGGQAASKLRPPYVEGREEIHALADVFEQRQTPSLFGLGLLDQVTDAEIIAHEDPTDMDSDGVFGVARRRMINGMEEVGRFGWKAQVPHLRDFVKDAMAGELGITTPDDGRGFAMLNDVDAIPDPELDEPRVSDMDFYMVNLAAPPRVGSLDPQVTAGELLFDQIGCAKCHLPELASPNGPVRAYTDLLLHRVNVVGFKGMGEDGAAVGLYRTPPLWGIRDTAPYMHDGAAEDLLGAITAHFREALSAKNAFLALSPLDQDAVLAFLNDL